MKYLGHLIAHVLFVWFTYEICIYWHKESKRIQSHNTHGTRRHCGLLISDIYLLDAFVDTCVKWKDSYWFNFLFLFPTFSKASFHCSKRTLAHISTHTWDDNAATTFHTSHFFTPSQESTVTQPCHLVELWRLTSLLVNRNLPHNYLPHLGRCLLYNIPFRSHLFFTCWRQYNTNQLCIYIYRYSGVSWILQKGGLVTSRSQKLFFTQHMCDILPWPMFSC